MKSENLDTVQFIGEQLATYAERLANYVITSFRNSSDALKFDIAGEVLLLINNEFITVSDLTKKLAKNAGGGCIYELWVPNYQSLIFSYRSTLS